MKIDRQYLQLLEILAQNCRISHAEIGRALKISKDTVNYRVRQLEESKLLNGYVLFVDARKLGFTRYHILVRFKNTAKINVLCRQLAKHEFVMWINSFIGRFDIQIIVDAVDGFHLNKIREELFSLCEHNIKDYLILTHLADLEFTQLNPVLDFRTPFRKDSDQSFSAELTTRNFPVSPDFGEVEVDRIDLEILRALADMPGDTLVSLSEKAGCERQTVKRRILRLIESGVILNFGAIPNLIQLDFVTYYLLVRLEQDTSFDEMKRPFLELNNIFYAGRMIGDYDMILYLNARNPQELNASIQLFRNKLKNRILDYDLLVQDQVHHWRQFTPGIYRFLGEKARG
jgi:Lrp/AsnC family transcriptional regulator, leucine-responsive regulatory protein